MKYKQSVLSDIGHEFLSLFMIFQLSRMFRGVQHFERVVSVTIR